MGCTNCGNGDGGMPRGCRNNGTCSSGGCNKLGVFDWLANMQLPNGKSQFDIVEIRFKNSRKSFFRNLKGLDLNVGDVVVVEASPGYDVGVVSVNGELSRIQLQKKEPGFKTHEARKIIRHATQEDIDKWVSATKREQSTMHRARELAIQLDLDMKISDVEYQGDGSKATFYYTANGRVDFRQLIKDMAETFRVRIEMRQIGARQEAARLGGIGSCGRELCCSTWLTDFRSVSTKAARYQQLSLNPQKLAGQCGKLKCCLNYELDVYVEALKDFPSPEIKLQTKKGVGIHIKTDVFKQLMWYLYQVKDEKVPSIIALNPERVKEIIELNKEKKYPEDLKDFMEEVVIETPTVEYSSGGAQDDLNRFSDEFKKKGNKRRKSKNNRRPQNKKNTAEESSNKAQNEAKTQNKKRKPVKKTNPKAKEGDKPNPRKTKRAPKKQSDKKPTNKKGNEKD